MSNEGIHKENNVFLILLRLNLRGKSPLGKIKSNFGKVRPSNSQLLVGFLDPSQRNTTTPLTAIGFTEGVCDIYNDIVKAMKELNKAFYSVKENGYLSNPASFDKKEKKNISTVIKKVGHSIFQLVDSGPNPLRHWLVEKTQEFEDGIRHQNFIQHVTIITNDFNIPWHWLRRNEAEPPLCEICSLGTLQLGGVDLQSNVEKFERRERKKPIKALIIDGDSSLPFFEWIVNKIEEELRKSIRRHSVSKPYDIEVAHSAKEVTDLTLKYPKRGECESLFKIVHFSGHYSESGLWADDQEIPEAIMDKFVQNSVLILDGCSSAKDLNAWSDLNNLTSRLINEGKALGCIVTNLPVKHDPIAGKILWGNFYSELRENNSSVGLALVTARRKLKNFYESVGSQDPSWLFYQLIGRPSIKLHEEEGS